MTTSAGRARAASNRGSMAVGGLALHWGGTTPRYSPEDFRVRSMYGIGGTTGRSPTTSSTRSIKRRRSGSGSRARRARTSSTRARRTTHFLRCRSRTTWRSSKSGPRNPGIPYWRNPVAKNSVPYQGRNVCTRCDTCSICPTGAKYTPDFTFQKLLADGRIDLLDRTLVRKLELADGSDRIDHAVALDRDNPDEEVHLRANTFVLASGLLLEPALVAAVRRTIGSPNGHRQPEAATSASS